MLDHPLGEDDVVLLHQILGLAQQHHPLPFQDLLPVDGGCHEDALVEEAERLHQGRIVKLAENAGGDPLLLEPLGQLTTHGGTPAGDQQLALLQTGGKRLFGQRRLAEEADPATTKSLGEQAGVLAGVHRAVGEDHVELVFAQLLQQQLVGRFEAAQMDGAIIGDDGEQHPAG